MVNSMSGSKAVTLPDLDASKAPAQMIDVNSDFGKMLMLLGLGAAGSKAIELLVSKGRSMYQEKFHADAYRTANKICCRV